MRRDLVRCLPLMLLIATVAGCPARDSGAALPGEGEPCVQIVTGADDGGNVDWHWNCQSPLICRSVGNDDTGRCLLPTEGDPCAQVITSADDMGNVTWHWNCQAPLICRSVGDDDTGHCLLPPGT
jgi:hypothetical protein